MNNREQQIRSFLTLRERSKRLTPFTRKNTALILRGLRKAFKRPAWMEPSSVPRMIYAMAERCNCVVYLFPPTRY